MLFVYNCRDKSQKGRMMKADAKIIVKDIGKELRVFLLLVSSMGLVFIGGGLAGMIASNNKEIDRTILRIKAASETNKIEDANSKIKKLEDSKKSYVFPIGMGLLGMMGALGTRFIADKKSR
jgi:hypothetical protein